MGNETSKGGEECGLESSEEVFAKGVEERGLEVVSSFRFRGQPKARRESGPLACVYDDFSAILWCERWSILTLRAL